MSGPELYARGAYWEAHEAWEGEWRAAPPGPARDRLRGLIQLCAAAVQAQRGRWRGVATLAARAEKHLDPVLGAAVRAWAAAVIAAQAWIAPPLI